jgi:glutaredoxin 3
MSGNGPGMMRVEPAVKSVTFYSADWCPFCARAKALLDARAIPYEEINVDEIPGFRAKLVEMTGRRTVPQIMIGDQPVGGFDDLARLDRAGELMALLED